MPESSEDIALRQLTRYFEGHQHRGLQRARFSPFLTSQAYKKHHLELGRQDKRDLLEVLADKTDLANILRKEKLGPWNYERQIQYNEPGNDLPREREYELPYYNLNPLAPAFDYPSLKSPYLSHTSNRQSANFQDENLRFGQDALSKHSFYRERDLGKGMKEEPMFEYHGRYDGPINEDDGEKELRTPPPGPEFTFKFDDSNLSEKHPFAVKPNDPRYYQDVPFSSSDDDNLDPAEISVNNTKWERAETIAEHPTTRVNEERVKNTKYSKFKEDSSMISLEEQERRTGYHPLIVPVNHDLNNDIYFIAIVAGCSAAGMFTLVLIILTWCRLQRGVKAAADIEYPAYGVTGPNKDVSPSGDQRLAQSAQMYHFQHQKQQIIAMENRTSATRGPGSVSEAESDEENEEGDYTVYECPGLASTGEMEVKNPLFHDDPTPATPAQTNKEEDHV